jgi:hypothetical protein
MTNNVNNYMNNIICFNNNTSNTICGQDIKNNNNDNNNKDENVFNFIEVKTQLENIRIKSLNIENKNYIHPSDSFNNLLIFSDNFNKINTLSNEIEELFNVSKYYVNTHKINTIDELKNIPKVIFNYVYEKEIERGNIEYKRSLESYNENDKTNKLIRQIYWRIYEGVVSIDKECCYYIIGIEDSGSPSFLTTKEIFNSLCFISETIKKTELDYSYLLVENTILKNEYMIVKFWPKISDLIDFF